MEHPNPTSLFDGLYALAHYLPVHHDRDERPIIVGQRSPRRCLFCGSVSPATTFDKRAHIIPEGLGNRRWFSAEECDDCNAGFGRDIEDHLLKFFNTVRSISPIRSRKGGVTHKTKRAKVVCKPSEDSMIHCHTLPDDDSVKWENIDNKVHLSMDTQPVSMMRVAKSIARMAIMAMADRERERLRHILDWVRGEVEHHPILHLVWIPGPGLNTSGLRVHLTREPRVGLPPMVVCYSFSSLLVFWHAPSVSMRMPEHTPMPTIGRSQHPPHDPQMTTVRIEEDVTVPLTIGFKISYTDRMVYEDGDGAPGV